MKVGEIYSEMVEIYGIECIDHTTVGRWCKMFKGGQGSLVYEIRSGRPVSSSTCSIVHEIDNVIQNRQTPLNELKERWNISYGSACDIVYEKLGCRKVVSRWVTKQLPEQPLDPVLLAA